MVQSNIARKIPQQKYLFPVQWEAQAESSVVALPLYMTLSNSMILRAGTVHSSHGHSKYRFCTSCALVFSFATTSLLFTVMKPYAQHIEHNRTMPTSSSKTCLTQGLCLARKRKSWTICKLCSFTNQSERKLRRREEMSVNGWVGVNWWQKDREAAGREKMAQHFICQIPQLKPL